MSSVILLQITELLHHVHQSAGEEKEGEGELTILTSSVVTKLIATPFRPNLPTKTPESVHLQQHSAEGMKDEPSRTTNPVNVVFTITR